MGNEEQENQQKKTDEMKKWINSIEKLYIILTEKERTEDANTLNLK